MTLNSQGVLSYEQIKNDLNPQIVSMVDQSMAQAIEATEVDKIGFQSAGIYTPNQIVDSAVTGSPMKRMTPGDAHPSLPIKKGYQKTVTTKQYGGKFTIEKEAMKWIQTADLLSGADKNVTAFLQDILTESKRISQSVNRNLSIVATSVLAKGKLTFNDVQGFTSLAPDGKALFAADHTTISGTSYDNTIATALLTSTATADVATNRDTIMAALNKYRTQMILDDGYPIDYTGAVFKLFCAPEYEASVRAALNENAQGNSTQYSGIGSNANAVNMFLFRGFMVEVCVLNYLGRPDLDGNTLGAKTSWFLVNTKANEQLGGFRKYDLWMPEIKTYIEQDTDNLVVAVDAHYGMDFFVPQVAMGYIA